jgi:cell division protease FtsH
MDILHAMSEALMKYETIDADQIKDIMEGREPREPKDWNRDDQRKPPNPSSGETVAGQDKPTPPIGGPAEQL